MNIIKYLMFFFNFLFWLSGLALIIVGAIIRDKYGDYFSFVDNKFANVPILLIVIGVIVFIIGFLGCCGAVKENYCMVTTFAVLLAIIFILEIVAGALGIAYKSKVQTKAVEALTKASTEYGGTSLGATHLLDFAQSKFKCCGANGTKSFAGNKNAAKVACGGAKNITVAGVATCHEGGKCGGELHADGCDAGFIKFVKRNLMTIGGVAIGIAFIQLIGIIFACFLMRAIKGEYEVV